MLLGFTPFGYDGVNQWPLEKPELKAIGPDGKAAREFGIGCRVWNLCPAKADSQRFMLEYIREMVFAFYPDADGLFIESSDYAICHCPVCGPRHFDHELKFVRTISDETWSRNPSWRKPAAPGGGTRRRLGSMWLTFGRAFATRVMPYARATCRRSSATAMGR